MGIGSSSSWTIVGVGEGLDVDGGRIDVTDIDRDILRLSDMLCAVDMDIDKSSAWSSRAIPRNGSKISMSLVDPPLKWTALSEEECRCCVRFRRIGVEASSVAAALQKTRGRMTMSSWRVNSIMFSWWGVGKDYELLTTTSFSSLCTPIPPCHRPMTIHTDLPPMTIQKPA